MLLLLNSLFSPWANGQSVPFTTRAAWNNWSRVPSCWFSAWNGSRDPFFMGRARLLIPLKGKSAKQDKLGLSIRGEGEREKRNLSLSSLLIYRFTSGENLGVSKFVLLGFWVRAVSEDEPRISRASFLKKRDSDIFRAQIGFATHREELCIIPV